MAGFLNGLATDGDCLKDEFFRNADLHDPTGDKRDDTRSCSFAEVPGNRSGIRTDAAVFRDTKAAGEMCVDPDMS